MSIHNETPFAAIGFGDLHRNGMRMAVTAVRGSYMVAADGVLTLAAEQRIILSDIYEGDPHRTPMICAGDLIPYKPAADVTVLGSAFPPNGRAARAWDVGLAVGGHTARLRVHGPRSWEPALSFLTPTWKLGPSTPAASVALDYRLAAGGYHVGDAKGRHEARNPLGPGVLRRDASRVGHPLRAPQVEALGEALSDPFGEPEPRGFGPVPPFWTWRERHLGTRDETWAKEICPQMPADFSYRFFQTAHPDLIVPRLRGGEAVQLDGLVPGGGALQFALPSVTPIARHAWRDGRRATARLTLDGLHIDLRDPRSPWRVDLTWRGWIVTCPTYDGATLALAPAREAVSLPGSDEDGLADSVEASA